MKKSYALAAALLLATSLPMAMSSPAAARSNIERNAQSGTEHGEASGFSAASPGIAAQGRYQRQSGWSNHRHHHHRRYWR